MNLNTTNQDTLFQQLQGLLRTQNDNAGNHSIWVDIRGDVHVNLVPQGVVMESWAQSLPDYKFRKETMGMGNGYVGPGAADHPAYVRDLLDKLIRGWASNIKGYDDT